MTRRTTTTTMRRLWVMVRVVMVMVGMLMMLMVTMMVTTTTITTATITTATMALGVGERADEATLQILFYGA